MELDGLRGMALEPALEGDNTKRPAEGETSGSDSDV